MTKPDTFPALVARDGVCATEQADSSLLHDGAVTVAVRYSSVNYKDALAVTGKGKILRASPMIPGIDYAGEVVESESEKYRPGDKVLLTGYGVGEKYSGGFAAYARANDSWLLPLPDGMDERQAMICGTAGLTAALCALSLTESGHVPEGGAIVVSGASGGVGSFSVSLLAKMGYAVTAISRPDNQAYLSSLGATAILSREEMSADARPLEKSRWAGAVDCVGGKILARMLAEMGYGGVVAACGLAADTGLQTTVMPFILRGVRLDGIDSVMIPNPLREKAWSLLAKHLKEEDYDRIAGEEIGLADLPDACARIMAGNANGRILLKI